MTNNNYAESKKKYYLKNAEKIKAANKARYHANKEKVRELNFSIEHLTWQVNKLSRITNRLGFIAILNLIALLFVCFVK